MHGFFWWVGECYEEDDPNSALQAIGNQMVRTVIGANPGGLFDDGRDRAVLDDRVNPFVKGDNCFGMMFQQPPAQAAFLGAVIPTINAMYTRLVPQELVQRYLADPTSDFAVRLRELVTHELLPRLRELQALILNTAGQIEMPSASFFAEKYPLRGSGSIEQQFPHVSCYTTGWECIVQQWSDGNFGTVQPYGWYPVCLQQMVEENIRLALLERQELLDSQRGAGTIESFAARTSNTYT